ncbi:bifunctional 5,10-methylene-tetrahydrofolate dehydrogenase/5,10-methylene-tetrahydrofolate cyclohydrolase [Prauserella sp. PE36]|uniref:bifunctional 5,10-methylenetetrahydrofolate dehydrogenase/5,10-methenyltetrahydrofolate cyclohydrolase n=1 Tax=Prauserella sp. PE36 TaxID=1504709 RepID=UPI000DE2B180|nr:bifunctional 5,10-methylenetetrahydrofolate dehydrogenase/5,10-methenyltetrahydrofolate cyclohydrolase [Prauserella sp. PE36]RBM18294.1 bifunctional 5,10-methylene-tetrahydrofolate dehydrogenase/5,10-methylene-tetrahydrofolate cyclohydrolase [Prauserella sp. PE36]
MTSQLATTTVVSGTGLARDLRAEVTSAAADLTAAGNPPQLAVVVATADESTAWYVRSIRGAATKTGIRCSVVDLGPDAPPSRIGATLSALSADPEVHGIMLQTPLPDGARFADLTASISPEKDVDGANPVSLGRLGAGLTAFAPATAAAVLALLDHYEVPLAGRHAVVVGRSTVVGKPAAQLLLRRDATVTVCHRHTSDLAEHTARADVLVVAVGRTGLITAEHVRPGAMVIDVGTNPTDDGGLAGDVDAAAVSGLAGGLTPVPGGVGPVTTALLLRHTVESAARRSP